MRETTQAIFDDFRQSVRIATNNIKSLLIDADDKFYNSKKFDSFSFWVTLLTNMISLPLMVFLGQEILITIFYIYSLV